MNIKIAKSVAAILLAQITLSAEQTQLDDVSISTTAFDAQVKTVSSKQLEDEQASDVKDILKSLPSVVVDGNARYGQKVYIRGLQDRYANITIDGAKQTSSTFFHHGGDSTVDASLLKITEVELGPNSALSGAGVINGSIKYETKDPSDFLSADEQFGGKISLGYETAKERKKGSVAVFGKVNEKLEFVGIGTIEQDGTLHLGNGEKVNSKESELKTGLAKIVYKPSEYSTVKLSYNRYEDGGDRQFAGEKIGTETNDNDYNSMNRDTFNLNYKYNPDNEYVNFEANAFHNKQYLERGETEGTDRTTGLAYTNPNLEYIDTTTGYDFRNSSLFGAHKITYGTDYTHEEQEVKADGLRVFSDNSTANLSAVGGEIDAYGLYLQDEMQFDKLLLTLGARYDYHQLGGIFNGTFKELSPKLKVKYQVNDELTLRAGYGRIFRGPILGELIFLNDTVTQSSESKPQTGHNFEVGLDYDLTAALNADDAIVGFNAYKYNVDDYAAPRGNADIAAGTTDMEIWGLETMLSYQKNNFSLNASHTYTGGEQTDNSAGVTFDPKTSKIHVFKLGLNYKVSNEFRVNYNSQFVPGNKWDSYSTRTSTMTTYDRKGYAVHDVNFTFNPVLLKNTTFNFGIGNIFNKAYVRHTAIGSQSTSTSKSYEVGRNFKFQVSYKF